jgi:hypothetical protein
MILATQKSCETLIWGRESTRGTLTGSDNTAALRLQERLGFRITNSAFCGAELEIQVPIAGASASLDCLNQPLLQGCSGRQF